MADSNLESVTQKHLWYASPNMSLRKASTILGGCLFALSALYYSGGAEFIYNQIVYPLQFKVRNALGLFPKLDPRIKIFAVDHKTMTDMQLETIPIEQWTALFKAIATIHPSAILIDKTFPLPLSKDADAVAELSAAISANSPVTAGAFFVTSPIAGFSEVKGLPEHLGIQALPWVKPTPGFLYGPHESLRTAFTHLGHVNYEENGFIRPVISLNSKEGIPFWGLSLADQLTAENESLFVNGRLLPVNHRGLVLVNLAPADEYWKRTYSLITLLQKARLGQQLTEVKSDDVVLILADMVQGSTAFKTTPAGTMPGGFVMAEVANSVLTGKWLRPVGLEPLFLLLGCILGMFLALRLNAIPFALALMGAELLFVGTGIAAFCFYGLLLPWAFPALGLALSSSAVFAEKTRIAEKKSRYLRFSLEGMIGPKKLNEMTAGKVTKWLQPKSQVLSIMFVDIVGFSMTAEQQSPELVFKHLRNLLSDISDIVHECGGIVDKSLGDGLLCFFGYEHDTAALKADSTSVLRHSEQALDCAIKIQRAAIERCLKSSSANPLYPLRIGINTGEVYIGDLGGMNRIEFTVIGHSVNYAQRLESACEIYHIMCGRATWDRIPKSRALSNDFTKKQIPVKHHEELSEAFEYNPFCDDPASLQQALAKVRTAFRLTRSEERFAVKPELEFKVVTNFGDGSLMDYSRSGVSIQLGNYFGKGTLLNLNLTSSDGRLQALFASNGITSISGAVRWSHANGTGFRHGIMFTRFTSEQSDKLVNCMRDY